MGVVDKSDVAARIARGEGPFRLELGCGASKRDARAIGIDTRDLPGVDLVGDALEALRGLPDASAERVASAHFLEHVADPRALLAECARVLTPGGRLDVTVPHFSNPYFYSDPTHEKHYGLYTLSYWVRDPLLRRNVPQYEEPLPLVLHGVRLGFRSPKAFPVRRLLKRPLGWLVNLGRGTQEFYEENLCWWLPCYEIHFELVRDR